jgi:hypothetical protein
MQRTLQHNRYSYIKIVHSTDNIPITQAWTIATRAKTSAKKKKNTATARLTGYASYCVFAGCKRYTLQCQYVLHQLSCPWGSPFRFVVPRGRDDLLALDSRLSSCSCLSSNNSDGSSVVVSGHGVRFAGTTTSKGGSITHLQKNVFSCG